MANYIATTEELTAVADAIRAKGGTTEPLAFPDGFVSAIEAIQTGGSDSPGIPEGAFIYYKRSGTSHMDLTNILGVN